jgi:antitoxin (DNA-binding transcriptional repressor) of toxin-antitoxin stability system
MRFLRSLVQLRKPVQTKSDQEVRLAQLNVYDALRLFCGLVERARRGEEVVVARSGRPIAKIVPYAGEATRPGVVTMRVVLRDEPDRRTAA